MTIRFDRPIGTPADLKELEYLSALHQTCLPKLRQDASIDAHDIANFLSSRHGIRVDVETVNKDIMVELGGDLRVDPMYKLDLCQVVAMLLIPHFRQQEKMLQTVLNAISPKSPKLTRHFMRKLLESQGEMDVPTCLLDDMMDAVGGAGTTLSTSSLLHAVTSDVTLYGVDWHERLTTHYQDVFFSHGDENVEEKKSTCARDEENSITTKTRPLTQLRTAAAVDTVADTYQSQSFTVLLWVCLVVLYLAYFWDFKLKWGQVDCSHLSEFTCTMVNGITMWLVIFIELTCLGTAFIIFGSAGNAIYTSKWMSFGHLIIGMATILFATILSLVYEVDTMVVNTTKKKQLEAAYNVAAFIGGILLLLQLITLIRLFFSLEVLKKCASLEKILTPGILKMERRTKLAANRKMSLLVENALTYHHGRSTLSASSMSGQSAALVNFQSAPEQTEKAGGIVWGWRKVWDGSIFEQEGVWLHSRLIASTVVQLFVCIFIIVFWAALLTEGLRSIDSGNDSINLDDDYDSDNSDPLFYVWEVVAAGSVGILSGLLACFAIAMVYIPSFISSVLQLRSGVIPSLRDREFLMYRYAEDQVTFLFGSAFWGCLFTGLLATAFVGGVVFITVWHVTRPYMLTLFAHLVGFAVTFGLKIIVLCFLRRQFRAAFYRKQPIMENIMNVMLECWNLGLSSGIMLIRTVKLLLITACYLGRIDTPVLAKGVGFIGSIALDSYPIAFRKDLLQHDAHRHPYLERLATLYMMKLRYGDGFGKRANSCWRLLVVLCLMPWMRKYRLGAASIEDGEEELETEKEKSPENTRFSAFKRMTSIRSLGHMDGVTSREDLLELEITILRERNRQLMGEITTLRERLVDDEDFYDAAESLNGEVYINEALGDDVTQCVLSAFGRQQGGEQDDWQLTTKTHEHLR